MNVMRQLTLGIRQGRDSLNNANQKGFFHLFSANIIVGFGAFGSQLLVAKFLTPAELGQIRSMQSILAVATVLAGFGFHTAVLKLCSENRSYEERMSLFRGNLFYVIIPTAAVLALLYAASRLGFLSPDRQINRWIPVYMLSLPAGVYAALMIAALQALKKIRQMARIQVILRVGGYIGLILFSMVLGFRGYIYASIFVGLFGLLPLILQSRDALHRRPKVPGAFRQSFYYSKWSLAANLVGNIGGYLDIFVLNYLIKDRTGLGYYSLATIFISGLAFTIQTVQNISLPYFSEKSGDKAEFLRVLRKYQKLHMVLALGVSLVSFFAVPAFIHVFFGKAYAPAGFYFRILLLKYLFWSWYALLSMAILGLGKIMYNFLSSALVLPVSFGLNYLLVRNWEFVGSAWAQALSYLISLLLMIGMTRRALRLSFQTPSVDSGDQTGLVSG